MTQIEQECRSEIAEAAITHLQRHGGNWPVYEAAKYLMRYVSRFRPPNNRRIYGYG